MTNTYDRAVDDLLDAIRIHLQHQHDRPPTDAAVAAYISRSPPRDMYHDLRQYPEYRTTARQLKSGRNNTSHVLYVMLWGRVNDWTATDHSPNEDRSKPQPDDTPRSE